MLHKVCSTIVHAECRLSELPRKSPSFNLTCERWPGNLVECFTHGVVSQAYRGRSSVFAPMMIILIIWERLARRSPWPASIAAIIFTIGREVKIGWNSFSSLIAQASLQVINFLLHGFGIFLLGEMATTLRMALASMGSMYTPLPVSPLLKFTKVILTLRPHGFCLVWTQTYHRWMSNSLSHQDLPQTMSIVRTKFEFLAQQTNGLRPNKPNTINL